MLNELIYKWRGIDKWPEATATVTSTEIVSEGGKLFVDDYSSIYGLTEKDTFPIQFNPGKPSHFYCKEAKSLSSDIRRVIIAIGVIFFIFVVLAQVLDHINR